MTRSSRTVPRDGWASSCSTPGRHNNRYVSGRSKEARPPCTPVRVTTPATVVESRGLAAPGRGVARVCAPRRGRATSAGEASGLTATDIFRQVEVASGSGVDAGGGLGYGGRRPGSSCERKGGELSRVSGVCVGFRFPSFFRCMWCVCSAGYMNFGT
jgi:hypothetical protein